MRECTQGFPERKPRVIPSCPAAHQQVTEGHGFVRAQVAQVLRRCCHPLVGGISSMLRHDRSQVSEAFPAQHRACKSESSTCHGVSANLFNPCLMDTLDLPAIHQKHSPIHKYHQAQSPKALLSTLGIAAGRVAVFACRCFGGQSGAHHSRSELGAAGVPSPSIPFFGEQGSLKDTLCPFATWCFSPKYGETTIYKAMFRCII